MVTLDRVVCCDPDAEALLRGAASRTRRLLAFSYPRDRWYMWILTALENFWRRLRGSPLRTFVHPPERMGAVLEAAGLVRVARQGTLVWVLGPLSPTGNRLTRSIRPQQTQSVGGGSIPPLLRSSRLSHEMAIPLL